MDGPIGNDVTALFLLELVLASFEFAIIEVELLVSCCNTDLILCDCLPSRGNLLIDCIVDAEPVDLSSERLDSLQFCVRDLSNLQDVAGQHSNHVRARQVLHMINLRSASL